MVASAYAQGASRSATLVEEGWPRQFASFFRIKSGPRSLVLYDKSADAYSTMSVNFEHACIVVFETVHHTVSADSIPKFLDMWLLATEGGSLAPETRSWSLCTPNGGGPNICLAQSSLNQINNGLHPVDVFWNSSWYGPAKVWAGYMRDGRLPLHLPPTTLQYKLDSKSGIRAARWEWGE